MNSEPQRITPGLKKKELRLDEKLRENGFLQIRKGTIMTYSLIYYQTGFRNHREQGTEWPLSVVDRGSRTCSVPARQLAPVPPTRLADPLPSPLTSFWLACGSVAERRQCWRRPWTYGEVGGPAMSVTDSGCGGW